MDINKEIKEILKLIKKVRKEKGYSQEDVAKHLNLSQNAYSLIERGETELSVKMLYKIADFLGIDLAQSRKDDSLIAIDPKTTSETLLRILKNQEDIKHENKEIKEMLAKLLNSKKPD